MIFHFQRAKRKQENKTRYLLCGRTEPQMLKSLRELKKRLNEFLGEKFTED